MTNTETQKKQPKGPQGYENWKLHLQGAKNSNGFEVPLFSDARIIGAALEGYGPYQFINLVADESLNGAAVAVIVLRVDHYLEFAPPDLKTKKSDSDRYHGAGLPEEIAALASVCLGARLKSGGLTRYFGMDEDPRGRPAGWNERSHPVMLVSNSRGRTVPSAVGEHNLDNLLPLKNYPSLPPEAAVVLVRAARFYQDAIWIAEAEPELSWLMLVSAIETAANYWKAEKEPALDRFRASQPELAKVLNEKGGEELEKVVAEKIADSLGATKKFIDFLMTFLPDPPATRPAAQYYQHEWTPDALSKTFKKIYGYRSKALHEGRVFPAPMCQIPHMDSGIAGEVPIGEMIHTLDGTWMKKDVPLHLHVFDYVCRQALIKWWASLVVVKD